MGRPRSNDNVYHLLIVRMADGFGWQVRFDRHAVPVRQSLKSFPSHAEALADGERALAEWQKSQT